MDLKKQLIKVVRERSFLKNEKPVYRLSSGMMSNFYFDLRNTTLSPEGQYLIGNLFCEKLKELGLKPKAIGGLTMGADPVASAAAYASYERGNPVEAFVIRKEPKSHGLMRQIEGNVKAGDDVVVIDDVVTTGKSTIMAIEAARKEGLKIIAVIALLDRCEQNGRENIEKTGHPFYSILTIRDFE
jgi:orotate phosphoribosyltransferase